MGILIIVLIMVLAICIIAIITTYRLDQDNQKMQAIIASLTTENIELEKNLEECKQTVKILQKLYKVSDKTLDLHTKHTVCWNDLTEDEKSNTMLDIVSSRPIKSGYPSELVDKHFDELIDGNSK